MDDLTELIGTQDNGKDLVDKLVTLLDRQTDHRVDPHILLGYLGMFNILSIMSLVHGKSESGIKDVAGEAGGAANGGTVQSLTDTISGLMNNQGGGQPDLMGLLSGLAAKKKVNPALLLSLFNMLNSQTGSTVPAPKTQSQVEAPVSIESSHPAEPEKKNSNDKPAREHRNEERRGSSA